MHLSGSVRRGVAGAAIVATLPLPVPVLMATTSGRLALASCLALPLVVLAGGPSLWPEWRGVGSLILVGPAVTTLLEGLIGLAFFTIGVLCTTDLSTVGACVAIAGFLVPYGLGSAWAVGQAERVIWAWPIVILLALAIGIGALALAEGSGAHHCET